jgi:hypothetical protein
MAQILELHRLDTATCETHLSSSQDQVEFEQKRRTWWILFISDRVISGMTGLPLAITESDVR